MLVGVPPQATHTAVLVLVPEAEPVVGALRDRLDPSAPQGVPAHVTVLFPFVPAQAVDAATVDRLRRAVAGVGRFDATFDAVRWFGEDYVWLAPSPAAPFAELTERVHRAFPDHPPYEGEHEPVPHLTVGYRRHSSLEALQRAADDLAPRLPITAGIDRVHLLAGSFEGDWRVVAEAPLDRRPGTGHRR
ncbi:2'-5' RNA ligase [Actinomycetospora succinea]|uniref:2'-5' RNA ligase n=1 Tax=Actinomycetospora succinea TaxID=663603 RepID=A0A4R6V2F9_9PSEU|nr:2'-5' RNA ligase family protein [Actinomycetospora succinea]TDQ52850.1 2'-5' RNA ligase [Actinomycetospora succinea]